MQSRDKTSTLLCYIHEKHMRFIVTYWCSWQHYRSQKGITPQSHTTKIYIFTITFKYQPHEFIPLSNPSNYFAELIERQDRIFSISVRNWIRMSLCQSTDPTSPWWIETSSRIEYNVNTTSLNKTSQDIIAGNITGQGKTELNPITKGYINFPNSWDNIACTS